MAIKKPLLTSIFILLLSTGLSSNSFSREIITGNENEEGQTLLTENGIEILNEELRQSSENIKNNTANILWESEDGDIELKTADDLDIQNKQLKGMVIENRTDDTGCTQTGRIWLRTN